MRDYKPEKLNFKALVKKARKQFKVQTKVTSLLSEIYTARQRKGESMEDFAKRLDGMQKKAEDLSIERGRRVDLKIIREATLDAFYRGMDRQIGVYKPPSETPKNMDSALRWAQAQSALIFDNDKKAEKKTTFKVNRVEEERPPQPKWSPGASRRSDSDTGSKKYQQPTTGAAADLSQTLEDVLKAALERIGLKEGNKPQYQRYGNKKNGFGKKKEDNNRPPSPAGGSTSSAPVAHSQTPPSTVQKTTRDTTSGNAFPPKA